METQKNIDLWQWLRGEQEFDGSVEQRDEIVRQICDQVGKNYRERQERERGRA